MNRSLLLGIWKFLIRVPRHLWQRMVAKSAEDNQAHPELRGTYMTLAQCVYITPKTQGALFDFPRNG